MPNRTPCEQAGGQGRREGCRQRGWVAAGHVHASVYARACTLSGGCPAPPASCGPTSAMARWNPMQVKPSTRPAAGAAARRGVGGRPGYLSHGHMKPNRRAAEYHACTRARSHPHAGGRWREDARQKEGDERRTCPLAHLPHAGKHSRSPRNPHTEQQTKAARSPSTEGMKAKQRLPTMRTAVPSMRTVLRARTLCLARRPMGVACARRREGGGSGRWDDKEARGG